MIWPVIRRAPGSDGYDAFLSAWIAAGRPAYYRNPGDGWVYQQEKPGVSRPTFWTAYPVASGDDGYDELYEAWQAAGKPGFIEDLSEGMRFRVCFPDSATQYPTFALEASSSSLSVDVGTQISWQRTTRLPIEEV